MYKINQNGVTRISDNAFIPNDPANMDWQAYLAWEAADNVPEAADQPVLADLKSAACDQIDQAAGAARAKYITVADGQEAVYQMKLDEAKAFQADSNPQAASYPHLNAEATATNSTMTTVSQLVIATYNAWLPLSAKIEGYRRGGDVAVMAATDAAGVQAALAAALASLEGC